MEEEETCLPLNEEEKKLIRKSIKTRIEVLSGLYLPEELLEERKKIMEEYKEEKEKLGKLIQKISFLL
jgi:hypothetical protein